MIDNNNLMKIIFIIYIIKQIILFNSLIDHINIQAENSEF